MPVVTQSRANSVANPSRLPSPHDSDATSGMPGSFYQEKLLNLEATLGLTNLGEPTRLDFNLNLAAYPAHDLLNLPIQHAFTNLADFRQAVAGSNDGRILHSLAQIVSYNMTTHEKAAQQHAELKEKSQEQVAQRRQIHKDLVKAEKDLAEIEHKFNNSQGEYQQMQQQRDEVQRQRDELQHNIELAGVRDMMITRENQTKEQKLQDERD